MFVNRLSKHMQDLGQMEVIGIAHVLKVILGVEIKLKMKKIVILLQIFNNRLMKYVIKNVFEGMNI